MCDKQKCWAVQSQQRKYRPVHFSQDTSLQLCFALFNSMPAKNLAVNDHVSAVWHGNGCYYKATVTEVNLNDGMVTVRWEDDDDSHRVVPFNDITKVEVETAAWSTDEISNSVYVKTTETKGRCLFTSKAVDPGCVIFIEAPTLCAVKPLAPDIWKQLEEVHATQPLSLGTIKFYFAAMMSILTLDSVGLEIILDKFVPDPDEPVSDDVQQIIGGLDLKHKYTD